MPETTHMTGNGKLVNIAPIKIWWWLGDWLLFIVLPTLDGLWKCQKQTSLKWEDVWKSHSLSASEDDYCVHIQHTHIVGLHTSFHIGVNITKHKESLMMMGWTYHIYQLWLWHIRTWVCTWKNRDLFSHHTWGSNVLIISKSNFNTSKHELLQRVSWA